MNLQTNRKHIMLVDDDEDVAELLGFVLRRAGFEVSCASNVRDAMAELARSSVPDLFILDLQMPELDGDYLLRWLRNEQKFEQPILMLTGKVRPGVEEHLKALGADAVAHKPIDIQSLNALVQELLMQ
ncbi:response regulator [Halopseudomonas sp.]|uniref:response regulator n=1 Tax=Halopseudomonas sp. TaxID=2901191 RepID=UPI00356856ED